MGNRNEVFFEMDTLQLYELVRETGFSICTDSRRIKEGDAFFALRGDNFNGNSFAARAIAGGASFAIIDDSSFMGQGTILVENVLEELQAIASIHRKGLSIPVLAVTGTNGKTTTKELLSCVLACKYKVHNTPGNLNNHIGVPLTLLLSPPDSEFMIVEMGANHIGEISLLCDIARPGYGIITNIGAAHLEGFGSIEGVVTAKSELYTYLASRKGIVLFNSEDELLKSLLKKHDVKSYPYMGNNQVRIREVIEDPFLKINMVIDGQDYILKSKLIGRYNYHNIMAAIGVGLYFDIKAESIIEAIQNFIPDNNRSQFMETANNTVICDAYNANPVSMSMALDSFINIKRENRTIIIGDMLELGKYTREEHSKVIERLLPEKDIRVILVGPVFYSLNTGTGYMAFENVMQLMKYLSENPLRNNFILVKGSRGIGLERTFDLF